MCGVSANREQDRQQNRFCGTMRNRLRLLIFRFIPEIPLQAFPIFRERVADSGGIRLAANIFVFNACGESIFSNGEAGIRTRDTSLTPYNGLANRRLQPLGHLSRN